MRIIVLKRIRVNALKYLLLCACFEFGLNETIGLKRYETAGKAPKIGFIPLPYTMLGKK